MFNLKNSEHITLALAGIVQAATLVNEIAVHGTCNQPAFDCLIKSIFIQNPDRFMDIYESREHLEIGLKQIIKLVQEKTDSYDRNTSRYVISLLHLARKLKKSPDRLNQVGKRIQQISQQVNYFSIDHPTIISNLAEVYLENISTYSFRIHVVGNPTYINNADNLNKIRALLLAGIRSCIAFEQAQGKHWHLFLFRKKLMQMAKTLLGN